MLTNSEEHKTDINKNISKLDEELEQEIDKANSVMRNLAESIVNVYNLARQKGYNPFDARKIVETRIINVTPQYVRRMLPEEAKHIEKRNMIGMRNKVSHPHPQSPQNVQEEEEQISTTITTEEFFNIPPNKFRKVFTGMMRLRQTAEQTGVRIDTKTFDVLV